MAEKAEEVKVMWENTEGDAVELYEDKKGEWRSRVQSRNGDILVISSEGYANEVDAANSLRVAGRVLRAWLTEVAT